MRSEELFSAIESIDPALLYDARAEKPVRLNLLRRAAVAAAVVLTVLAGVLIYANFVMPASYIGLECREAVLLSVNARGNVLSLLSDSNVFSEAVGKPAPDAVEMIVGKMIEKGALDQNANTLMVSADDVYLERTEHAALYSFERHTFDGCVVSVASGEKPAEAFSLKDELIDLVTHNSDSLTYDSLRGLSINDLGLLINEMDISDERLHLIFEPSQSGCIGREEAMRVAVDSTALPSLDSVTAEFSVYHRHLIYLVTLRSGESAEAYFISALDGVREHTVRASSAQISQAAQNEVKSGSASPSYSVPISNTASSPEQNISSAKDDENTEQDQPSEPEHPQKGQESNIDDNTEYRTLPVTMRELSFSTLTPPDSAQEIPFGVLFEGQCFEERDGERMNEGGICVIENLSQWNKFLSKNNKNYRDKDGKAFEKTFTDSYFEQRFLLISVYVFSDTSCYTAVSSISEKDSAAYIEDSLVYGEDRSGEYYCRALSVYELSREDVSPDMAMNVY